MTPTPSRASAARCREELLDLRAGQRRVGSSMIRMRASSSQRLARSRPSAAARCRDCADRRARIDAPTPSPSSRRAASRRIARAVDEPGQRVGSRPRKMFSATERCGDQVELLVDDADARRLGVPRAVGSRPPRRRAGSRRRPAGTRRSGSSSSVDLPAPFSPSSTCTSPALQLERHVVERHDAGNACRCLASAEPASSRLTVTSTAARHRAGLVRSGGTHQRLLYRDLQLSAFSFQHSALSSRIPDPGSRIPDPDRIPSMSSTEHAQAIEDAAAELRALLGSRASDAAAVREHHSHGESYHPPAAPDIVCFPRTTDEVAGDRRRSARAHQAAGHAVRRRHLARRTRPRHPRRHHDRSARDEPRPARQRRGSRRHGRSRRDAAAAEQGAAQHRAHVPGRSRRRRDDRRHGRDARVGHDRRALRDDARERARR